MILARNLDMPYRLKDPVRHKFKKTYYNKRDWATYDKSLKNRGSLTIWFSEEAIAAWEQASSGLLKRGRQKQYSDLAIETSHTLRLIYKLGLRQTEGFIESIVKLLKIDLSIPDHTTLSRRAKTVVLSPPSISSSEPLRIIVDSTGLKVSGEKEWMAYKHGTRERKVWRKLHLCITEAGDILRSTLTCHTTSDTSQVTELLKEIKNPITLFMGDGGYDHPTTYKALENQQKKQGSSQLIKIIIPPNLEFHKEIDSPQRLEHHRWIEDKGKVSWQKHRDYGKRSRVENTIYRYKAIIGNTLKARHFDAQVTETQIAVQILNKMTKLGIPKAQKST